MELTKRGASVFDPYVNLDGVPITLKMIADFAGKRPVVEFGNYGDRKSYAAEMRQIAKDLSRVRVAMRVALAARVTDYDVIEASKRAFSGRLSIRSYGEGFILDYCTGQYYPTEYRKAAAAVLEEAARIAANKE